MTLAGPLRHLTVVGCGVFRRGLDEGSLGAPRDEVDWDGDPDWEWRTAAQEDPDGLRATWREAVDGPVGEDAPGEGIDL